MSKSSNNGVTEIPLKHPYQSAGKQIEQLLFRQPKVMDLKAASRFSENSADQEVALLAILCDLVPEDLNEMHLADFQALQACFRSAVS